MCVIMAVLGYVLIFIFKIKYNIVNGSHQPCVDSNIENEISNSWALVMCHVLIFKLNIKIEE